MKRVLVLCLVCFCTSLKIDVTSPLIYKPNGWVNDPNGLLYVDGVYHMFYQFNPTGEKWGNLSWGHAESRDLVSWSDQGVALPFNEGTGEWVFSGSAVYDVNNTSGFGSEDAPPLVAIYTSYYTKDLQKDGYTILRETQSQSLAYSIDKGNTWKFYPGNPVIRNPPEQYKSQFKDFRDPKVIWYEPDRKWVLIAVLSKLKKALFYSSSDLKEWSLTGEFTSLLSPDGIWECPDLVEMNVAGEAATKWVLFISTNPGSVAGGSGMHYYIGHFDGNTFTQDSNADTQINWLDYGADFYAGQIWDNTPKKLMIGWINNWLYANTIVEKWNGGLGSTREVSLVKKDNTYKILQTPLPNLQHYADCLETTKEEIEIEKGQAYEINTKFLKGDKFILDDSVGKVYASISFSEKIVLVRKINPLDDPNQQYVEHLAPIETCENLKILIDDYSLTIYLGQGNVVLTEILVSKSNRRLRKDTASEIEGTICKLSSS